MTTKIATLAAAAAVGLSTLAPVAAQAADRRTEHALLGGALGALAGGLIGGDATGALVGAGAGALLGAATTRDHHSGYGYGYRDRYDGGRAWNGGYGYGRDDGYRAYRTSYDYGGGGYDGRGYDRGGYNGGYGYDQRGYGYDRGRYGYAPRGW